jgi:hypothetical protein
LKWNNVIRASEELNFDGMKKMFLLLLVLVPALFRAQAVQYDTLDMGNFVASISADGQLYEYGGLQWPKTTLQQDRRVINYLGHIWFGGFDPLGTLRVAAETYGQSGRGFYPGLANFDTLAWDSVWKITRAEVDQFRADFANSTVNFANYPIIASWPVFALNLNNDLTMGAPFVNMDNDPSYTPTGGDYPDFPGDQAIYFQFSDYPSTLFPARTGLEVRAFAYVYDCPELEDVLFLEYNIKNPTETILTDFRLGLWQDFDLGNAYDDYVGSDSLRGMMFVYNGDAYDETANGYGLNPPAAGIINLRPGASGSFTYENDFSLMGNPQTANDHYNYLRSYWKNSQPLQYMGTGAPTTYPYTGDAGWCGGPSSGWTEGPTNNPFDRRALLSTAPTTFAPSETKRYTFGVLMARGLYNDNLGSVCELQQLADSLRYFWDNHSFCGNLVGITPPQLELAVDMYPNPTHNFTTIQFENADLATSTLQLFDIAGRAVRTPQQTRGEQFTLDLRDMPAGIYWLKLQSGDKTYVGKLLRY